MTASELPVMKTSELDSGYRVERGIVYDRGGGVPLGRLAPNRPRRETPPGRRPGPWTGWTLSASVLVGPRLQAGGARRCGREKTRLEVERAVMESGLCSSDRTIIFTLLARDGTALDEHPPTFRLGLRRLAAETGLDRWTVRFLLRRLVTEGWITPARPSATHDLDGRIRWRLVVPDTSTPDR